jgi:hypothetical protein
MNATYTRQAAEVAAADEGLKGAARGAKIKTAYAANGIDLASGSAQDVMASQKATEDVDIDRIFHNADMSAYGYTTQAKNFENEAPMKLLEGVTGAVGTLAERAPTINWKMGGGNSWTAGRDSVFG